MELNTRWHLGDPVHDFKDGQTWRVPVFESRGAKPDWNGVAADAHGSTREIARSRAHLIAAAPELLAELKAMHEHHHPDCQDGCPTLAIIAKAEGE